MLCPFKMTQQKRPLVSFINPPPGRLLYLVKMVKYTHEVIEKREMMPRQSRQISKIGIYHVLVRGINRGALFHDDEDRQRYLYTLTKFIKDNEVLGYCLMDNHVHLLIKEGLNGISNLMHRLGASYAYFFNNKYERVGHVFQNRFKSENVEDDSYLKVVIRYIHQNPIKAGMVNKAESYRWSSCQAYYGGKDYFPGLTSTDLILSLFSEKKEHAIMIFRQFTEVETSDRCLEDIEITALTEVQAHQAIEKVLDNKSVIILNELSKADRDLVVRELKAIEGLSIRQISRLTGVSFNIVKRA